MVSTMSSTEQYASIYGPVLPDDDRLLDLQPGEEFSEYATIDGLPTSVFTQRCLHCGDVFTEQASLPAPGVKRVAEIDRRRSSIALRCDIHMAASHGQRLGDDPRLPEEQGKFRASQRTVKVQVDVEEEYDPGYSLCGDCGEVHEIWKGCRSDLGKITGVAR